MPEKRKNDQEKSYAKFLTKALRIAAGIAAAFGIAKGGEQIGNTLNEVIRVGDKGTVAPERPLRTIQQRETHVYSPSAFPHDLLNFIRFELPLATQNPNPDTLQLFEQYTIEFLREHGEVNVDFEASLAELRDIATQIRALSEPPRLPVPGPEGAISPSAASSYIADRQAYIANLSSLVNRGNAEIESLRQYARLFNNPDVVSRQDMLTILDGQFLMTNNINFVLGALPEHIIRDENVLPSLVAVLLFPENPSNNQERANFLASVLPEMENIIRNANASDMGKSDLIRQIQGYLSQRLTAAANAPSGYYPEPQLENPNGALNIESLIDLLRTELESNTDLANIPPALIDRIAKIGALAQRIGYVQSTVETMTSDTNTGFYFGTSTENYQFANDGTDRAAEAQARAPIYFEELADLFQANTIPQSEMAAILDNLAEILSTLPVTTTTSSTEVQQPDQPNDVEDTDPEQSTLPIEMLSNLATALLAIYVFAKASGISFNEALMYFRKRKRDEDDTRSHGESAVEEEEDDSMPPHIKALEQIGLSLPYDDLLPPASHQKK